MSKYKLLLADDSVTIQKVVNLTFADEGIEVITAGDGNTAMEKFVESTPDLVMVDVNMPGFDGYRICEMIKQDEETKHIPVILLVGSFEPFDEAEARRVGADDYLTKPFHSIRQLVSRVSDLLNRSNGENPNYSAVVAAAAGNTENAQAFDGGLNSFSAVAEQSNFTVFDTASLDDEMIQTDQIGSLPADETQKFVFDSSHVSLSNGFADSSVEETIQITTEENETEENEVDLLKMDSYQDAPFLPLPITSSENDFFRFDEKIDDFVDQPAVEEKNPFLFEQKAQDFPAWQEPSKSDENSTNDTRIEMNNANPDAPAQSENDSFFDLDDLFLELPPLDQKTPSDSESTLLVEEIPANVGREIAEELTVSAVETNTSSAETNSLDEKKDLAETTQLSPEVIEAIAKRIMEKLSDKVIKEIAREMTPQMAESVIKEMAQRKTN